MNDRQYEVGSLQKRAYAEINMNNAEHNYRLVRAAVDPAVKLCCVVKANAYGHGAVHLGRLYESLGADMLAVSNIAEAMQLRTAGIGTPIFILGYTPADCAKILADNRIAQCVYSLEYAKQLSAEAAAAGVTVGVHIKLDSGMGRIGFRCPDPDGSFDGSGDDGIDGVERALALPGLVPVGVFTHFAVSDEGADGEEYTRLQYARFSAAIAELESRGVVFPVKHCSNSAAILDYPGFRMDMVRAGVILYGLQPSSKIRNRLDLRPVMSLRSVVSHVKTVRPGDRVSYGGDFVADRSSLIATVPVGYADGFFRSNYTGGGSVELANRLCPIVGRICMDQLMIDVSSLPVIPSVGDEVTVFGSDLVTADDVARVNRTINYEICCLVGERVPRIYTRDGSIVAVVDYVMNLR